MKIAKLKIENSTIKTLVFLLLLTLYGSFLTHKIVLPVYDDLPRQIKIGEEIVHGNFDIFYKNVFSYTEPEHNFYNHHWLSAVIFYLLHVTIGWGGLVIFKTIILLLFFSILFFAALKRADFWIVASTSLLTILIFVERTGLRPEVFSYLFIAIFLYILFDFEKNPESKKIFWLIPLQLLWVNMHVFFSIGIMITAGLLLEKIFYSYKELWFDFKNTLKRNKILRKIFIVFLGVVLVSFINLRGWEGVFYRYPANFPATIIENQTIAEYQRGSLAWDNISVASFKISVILLIAAFVYYFWQKRKSKFIINNFPFFYFLASLSTIILGFMILRGISLFAIVFLVVFTALINEKFVDIKKVLISRFPRIGKISITIFILVIICLLLPQSREKISSYTKFGLGLTPWSNGGAEFFKNHNLHGPIFNDADIGSYLIYHLYPREKVFTDNRFGDAYSPGFFNSFYFSAIANEEVWLEVSKRYDFGSIFFYQYDKGSDMRNFLWRRLRDPAWSLVYIDMYSIIFIRNLPENKELLEKFSITRENIRERLSHLSNSSEYDDKVTAADAFNLIGREDLGSEMFLEIIYKWPEKGHIWMVMGEWELAIDQYRSHLLAMMYLEKAISLGHKTAEAYSFLGMAYNKLYQKDKAIEALEKALKINPDRRDAKDLLYQIDGRTQ